MCPVSRPVPPAPNNPKNNIAIMPLKIIPMPGMNRFEKTLPAMSCSVVVTDCLADQASPSPHLFNKSAPHAQTHYSWPRSQS